MTQPQPNRRQRRQSRPRSDEVVEPNLVAFLLCKGVNQSDDGGHNISGIFDGLTVTAFVPPGSAPDLSQVAVNVRFVIFTRWLGGTGIFKQWIDVSGPGIVGPDDTNTKSTDEVDFWLRDQFKAHNVITRVNLGVREGVYYFDLKLNGSRRARVPLRVKLVTTTQAIPQQ